MFISNTNLILLYCKSYNGAISGTPIGMLTALLVCERNCIFFKYEIFFPLILYYFTYKHYLFYFTLVYRYAAWIPHGLRTEVNNPNGLWLNKHLPISTLFFTNLQHYRSIGNIFITSFSLESKKDPRSIDYDF